MRKQNLISLAQSQAQAQAQAKSQVILIENEYSRREMEVSFVVLVFPLLWFSSDDEFFWFCSLVTIDGLAKGGCVLFMLL